MYAGNIPNINPIKLLAINEIITILELVLKLNPNVCNINPILTPKITPKVPPKIHNISDSTKNCTNISFLFAPKDFLIPISFVRSVTETNITFITPIPPTNTENIGDENNEEIVKEITKIITVVEKNNENKEEENTNISNDKKPENKQEMSNEEKSNSKQEQKNSNEKTSNNIENQKISVSGSAKSSLSGTSVNTENQETYNGSNNNYLEKLEVEGKELNTSFNKENDTYFIDINNTNTINVTAIAEDSTAKVYITGNDNIESGNNKILISVTAENGDVRYYRIFVNCEEETNET